MSMRAVAGVMNNSSSALKSVTPTASPFTYTNTSGGDQDVVTSNGVVTTISYSRDQKNFILVGLLSGMYRLSAGDSLQVAYVTAPIITVIPR